MRIVLLILFLIEIQSNLLQRGIDEIFKSLYILQANGLKLGAIVLDVNILTHTQMYYSQPRCKEKTISDNGTYAYYSNCLILVYSDTLFTIDQTNINIDIPQFYVQLNFSSFEFELVSNKLEVAVKFSNYKYNEKLPYFSMSFFNKLIDLIPLYCNALSVTYIELLKSQIKNYEISEVHIGDFNAVYNLVSLNGPYFDEKISIEDDLPDQLTFISYLPSVIEGILGLQSKILMDSILIPFEYSIDCDLNYNEGSFVLKNIEMSLDQITNDTDDNYMFKPTNLTKSQKQYILYNFSDKFRSALKSYYDKVINRI